MRAQILKTHKNMLESQKSLSTACWAQQHTTSHHHRKRYRNNSEKQPGEQHSTDKKICPFFIIPTWPQ